MSHHYIDPVVMRCCGEEDYHPIYHRCPTEAEYRKDWERQKAVNKAHGWKNETFKAYVARRRSLARGKKP